MKQNNNLYNEYYNFCYGGSFLSGELFFSRERSDVRRSSSGDSMRSTLARAYADAASDKAALSELGDKRHDALKYMNFISMLRSEIIPQNRFSEYCRIGRNIDISLDASKEDEASILKKAYDFVQAEREVRRSHVPISQTPEFVNFISAP